MLTHHAVVLKLKGPVLATKTFDVSVKYNSSSSSVFITVNIAVNTFGGSEEQNDISENKYIQLKGLLFTKRIGLPELSVTRHGLTTGWNFYNE